MAKRIELAKFPKRADALSMLAVTSHVALVIAPLYIAAYFGPGFFWIALWIWFGVLMNGLLNLMHECAHYHVFHGRGGSDFLGRWVLGPLAATNFDAYRARHWKHHTHLGTDGDTKDAYLVDIRGAKLLGFLGRCLLLAEAMRKFRHQTGEDVTVREKANSYTWIARTAVVHALLFASLVLVAGPVAERSWRAGATIALLAYVFASLTVFAATLRAIAEHQLEFGQSSETGRAALRNFHCGPMSLLVFGAYGFAEHGTHHREPGLPYYRLGEATRELAVDNPELAPSHEYIGELAALVRSAETAQPGDTLLIGGKDS
jgi:fatty acid desaturase